MSKPVYVLQGLAGFVLLLACANLANLLLARAAAANAKWACAWRSVRVRGRILRQMFTESLLLSRLGGAAGLLLAYVGRNAIPRMMTDPWGNYPSKDASTGGSSHSLRPFPLPPACSSVLLRRGRPRACTSAPTSKIARRPRRIAAKVLGGKAIVVVQVSLAMLLLVGAGLFVRTL